MKQIERRCQFCGGPVSYYREVYYAYYTCDACGRVQGADAEYSPSPVKRGMCLNYKLALFYLGLGLGVAAFWAAVIALVMRFVG